jgi:uncharacterized membrane protein
MEPRRDKHEDAWFEYHMSPGRIQAVPVNRAGWLTLLAGILTPLIISLIAALLFYNNVAALVGIAIGSMLISLGTVVTLAFIKGRRA